jgi:hypothetical protein
MLNQFAGDIAGIQVGKNQDVRYPRNLAVRHFSPGNLRNERSIHLQFTLEIGFDHFFVCLLGRQCGRSPRSPT